MIRESFCYHMPDDEDVWVVPVHTRGELEKLFRDRRAWVHTKARVPIERPKAPVGVNGATHQKPCKTGETRPAKLNENFVMIFKTLPGSAKALRGNNYLVEGIDSTGLIVVRSRAEKKDSYSPLSEELKHPGIKNLDIHVYRDHDRCNCDSGPWLFSAHMEIGRNEEIIAKRLLKAKHDSEDYFKDLVDPNNYHIHLYDIKPGYERTNAFYHQEVRFELPAGVSEPEVIYQGKQKLDENTMTVTEDPPPSCNPIYGTCVEEPDGTLVCYVDTVTVKAYEEVPDDNTLAREQSSNALKNAVASF